ncbi:uncharacterized protein TM35_000112440 [Trypanosoma theileri]|uniref:Uncharacterized protein n=1 Tax=Trypanosoma theileri TaxID=67003 RepID=A0A1X0NZX9_9TRYP|nr:uncharacterized protein TM35_000112440 [Trypanosoma theileri]ORC89710.1 hypothetical protein TM35_000112440 [Trypanosoma theileri]
MESPINPDVWRFLFHTTAAALSAATLFSLYHERYNVATSLDSLFYNLKSAKTDEESTDAVEAILSKLKEEAAQKKGLARLSALRHGGALVRLAALRKDGSNLHTVSAAIKTIVRVFGADAASRRQLYMLGGYRTLLLTLSEAHRQGLQELMEDTAQTLQTLTKVDDAEVVLESDVPAGAEGTYALACMPATVKMLRVLDPNCSILFLNALTGIFANVCTLRVGAVAVGRGVEGRSGMSYFLRLLEHGNQAVVEHCALTIRYLARAGQGHEEIANEENLQRLAENLTVNGDPRVTNSILTIILVMFDSKHGVTFFENLATKTDIIPSLFEIWCRSSEKMLRDRAEVLVQLLARVPQCTEVVHRFLERYRSQIADRRAKDEEARRKQLQQMRQSQMMQQMMMESMGMGGGMDLSMMMGGE